MHALHTLWRIAPRMLIATTIFLVFLVSSVLMPVHASGLTADHSPTSKTTIKYDDLDFLMKQTVLKLGRSDHVSAPAPTKITGTNLLFDNPEPSRLEGNRVLFHQNQDDLKSVSAEIRDSMLAIPAQVPLERMSKNEQLAYLLNLHNIIVYNELANRYPITNIEDIMAPCPSETSIRCEARYNMAGTLISLDDIERHIVENWDSPLVIYGFYMGAVGTPNIRAEAYTGSRVYAQLKSNAEDFINSVRGTRAWSSKTLRVSNYYERMNKFFPDFKHDLMVHIRDYAEPEFAAKISRVTKIRANIDDWHIADLYNGHLSDPAGINGLQRINKLGGGHTGIPAHVSRLLEEVLKRNSERRGQVSVEEYVDTSEAAPAQTPDADTPDSGNGG